MRRALDLGVPGRSQGKAEASAMTGRGESCHWLAAQRRRDSGTEGSASPGPTRRAVEESGGVQFSCQGRTMTDCSWLATGR